MTDAATELGIHIPIYCSHPKMDPVAVCRMCLVHVEKMPKLQPACATYVAEGMVVDTQRADVAKTREGMLEFLLLNHPLDCPVCDRGGECDLQDFAFRYGPPASRFPITEKVHFNKAVVLSEKIELDQERCILCWRCTRYYDEITGEKELVLQERGVHTLINTFDGQPLKSDFQGNLPEICPVGALTHRQYRFKARPWDLQRTKSVCPECSYGCNINVDTRDFEVRRFASRDNPQVDDMWLCDRGRYSAESWNDADRDPPRPPCATPTAVRDVSVSEAIAAAARALRAVRDAYGAGAIAVLGSAAEHQRGAVAAAAPRPARCSARRTSTTSSRAFAEHRRRTSTRWRIAEIEECAAVIVLGAEPEHEAPVLTLRLHKAATKRGVVGAPRRARRQPPAASASCPTGSSASSPTRSTASDAARLAGELGTVARGAPAHHHARRQRARRQGCRRPAQHRPGLRVGRRRRQGADARSSRPPRPAIISGAGGAWAAALWADDVAPLVERVAASVEVLVVIDTGPGPLSRGATVLIPGHAYFEKAGTVTNVEGRVQRIRPALPPATQTPTETRILSALAAELGAAGWPRRPAAGQPRAGARRIPAYARRRQRRPRHLRRGGAVA